MISSKEAYDAAVDFYDGGYRSTDKQELVDQCMSTGASYDDALRVYRQLVNFESMMRVMEGKE